MNYKYSKWSDRNGVMNKSKRIKNTKSNQEQSIDKYETEKNMIDILSKKQKISDEQNNRTHEREQDIEKKRIPGLIDFQTVHNEPSGKNVSNERISNRYMVIQKSINPFLSTSNYIGDLEVQDKLLRPIDSNI